MIQTKEDFQRQRESRRWDPEFSSVIVILAWGLALDRFISTVVDTKMWLSGIFQRVLDATGICGEFIVVAVWLFMRRGRDLA